MARRRMIDPNFWESIDVWKLTIRQRLLAIGLISLADDEGRGLADPLWIKAKLFPHDDEVRTADIEADLGALQKHLSFVVYETEGKIFYEWTNWRKWQTVDKPRKSNIPPPPENSDTSRGIFGEYSGNSRRTVEENSPTVPGNVDNQSDTTRRAFALEKEEEIEVEDELEKEYKGDKAADAADDADASSPLDLVKPGEIAKVWNEICGDVLPKATKLTDERRRKIRARLAESTERRALEWWRNYFSLIRQSPFLCGNNDRGWRADFDWAIRSETVITRVLEGRYRPKTQATIPRAFASLMEWAEEVES